MKCQLDHAYYRGHMPKIGGPGYTLHDSNYLGNNRWVQGYTILLGRNRHRKQLMRVKDSNRTGGIPPNELI
jgi:hypothetical protein